MKEIVNFNSQQESYTPLQLAVLRNRSDEIIRLLSQNVSLNAKYQFSLTALHFAALMKNTESLQLLIAAGADINVPNSSGRTPLHLCASNGFAKGLELLLAHYADPDRVDNTGCAPLHLAAANGHLDCVKSLVKAKACLQVRDYSGRTILHDASRFDHLELTRYLIIECKLNPDEKDTLGRSSLVCARGLTHSYLQFYYSCMNELDNFQGVYRNCLNQSAHLSLFVLEILIRSNAFQRLDEESFRAMVVNGDRQFKKDFMIRFCQSVMSMINPTAMENLIEKFIDESLQNNLNGSGKNLLHIAAETNSIRLIDQCLNKWSLESAQLSQEGLSPLMIAFKLGHTDFVKMLCSKVEMEKRLEILLGVSNDKRNVLHFLTESDNLEMLVFLKETLADRFSKLIVCDEFGNSVVHYCAMNRSIKIFERLLTDSKVIELIANDTANNEGYTAQHLAAMQGHHKILDLLRKGCPNFSVADINGNTPLHHATRYHHLETVKYLIRITKVDKHLANQQNLTPLDISIQCQSLRIKNLLSQATVLEKKNQVKRLKKALQHGLQETVGLSFPHPIINKTINALIFEGGGVKGIAYYGALKKLQQRGVIDINEIIYSAGTSAGAITALLLSAGYGIEECGTEIRNLDFEELIELRHRDLIFALKDGNYQKLLGSNLYSLSKDLLSEERNGLEKIASFVSRFFSACEEGKKLTDSIFELYQTLNSNFGIFDGNILLRKFEDWIERKTGNRNLTFSELQEKVARRERSNTGETFKSLYVIGYSLNSPDKIQIFSHETTPDDVIAHAIRISAGIPVFFTPHRRHIKRDGRVIELQDEGLYVDGGVAKNHPIDIFDNVKYFTDTGLNQSLFNQRVLGFKLVSSKDIDFYTKELPSFQPEAETLFQYLRALISAVAGVQEANFRTREVDIARTIIINTGEINAVDFNLDPSKQRQLIESGENAAGAFNTTNATSRLSESACMAIKMILQDYLHLDPMILYSSRLENLWNCDLIKEHDPMLLYKLIKIPQLSIEDFKLIVLKFKLNLNSLDDRGNTVAHLLAAEGNLPVLKQLYKIKPNMLLAQNTKSFTPITIFCRRHLDSQELKEQFIGFCLTNKILLAEFKASSNYLNSNLAVTLGIFRRQLSLRAPENNELSEEQQLAYSNGERNL